MGSICRQYCAHDVSGNVEIVRRVVESFNESGMGSEVTLSFFDAAAVFEEPPEQPRSANRQRARRVRRGVRSV